MTLADVYSTALVQTFVHRYQSLSGRDQLAVKYLLFFLLLLIIFYAVLMPSFEYNSKAKQQYQQAVSDFQWMKEHAPANATSAVGRNSNESLLGVASSSAKTYYVVFKRYEATDENTLSINLERVLFKNLILWLDNLEKQYGVSITKINIEQQGAPSYVNARVVIKG